MILLRDRGWKRIFGMFFSCRRLSSFFFFSIFLSTDFFLKNCQLYLRMLLSSALEFVS